ncbi:hypothetical protein FF011L_12540 [Roseimaritima multifibrata]|uniref:Uncharacterized protein n=1 Tax=Roseimaritima multifibrata TaxID=1930274 RepID=A0A517MC89_9BACT|nr:hypothetical protein [Roseimaritima multifibrata]QDS92508.1 hypothetical protein FF011L_12540 [Roseimaritima multifibrata]
MIRIYRTAALPPYPPLYFDDSNGEIMIVGRHAAGWGLAMGGLIAQSLLYASSFWVAFKAWEWIGEYPFEAELVRQFVLLVQIFGAGIVMQVWFKVVKHCCVKTLKTWLAERVFYSTVRIYINRRQVGFKCRRYRNGVVLPRRLKARRIRLEFISTDDRIDPYGSTESQEQQMARRSKRCLLLVVSTWPQIASGKMPGPPDRRAFPIAEMPTSICRKFNTVCNAALRLSDPTFQPKPQSTVGQDIDA